MLTASYLPASAAQRATVVRAFVGADRDRPLDAPRAPGRGRPAAAAPPAPRRPAAQAARLAARLPSSQPSLASTMSVAFGRGGAHRGDARGIAAMLVMPPSLTLSSARRGGLGGGRGHGGGRAERDRIGGGERAAGRAARQAHAPGARCAWLRGPRTRSRAHCGRRPAAWPLQGRARSSPAASCGAHGLDLRHDALDAFAVAGIGHAFAAAACLAVAQFGDHDHGLGLGAAADGEGTGDRPAFGGKGEG